MFIQSLHSDKISYLHVISMFRMAMHVL